MYLKVMVILQKIVNLRTTQVLCLDVVGKCYLHPLLHILSFYFP